MPKRPKSPEPVEDSKFLTVVHPYPLNANMEVPSDFKEFMYWLACIAGKDYVFGVHYKPSARGMVIAEVSKTFPAFDKLLGEHRWGEFLRNPSKEERDRKSRVYYSIYSNARAAQKDGWKYLHADDELFKDLVPRNMKIQFPYPNTRWCDVPYEDPTGKSLCRPLPVQTKAPPPRPPVQVPGSSTWISQRRGVFPAETPNERAKGQKSGPSRQNTTSGGNTKGKPKSPINPNAWKTPITASPTTPTNPNSHPERSSFTNTAPPISVWTKSLPPPGAEPSPGDSIPTPPDLTTPPSPKSLFPPGLGPPSNDSRPTNPLGSSSIKILQNRFAKTSLTAPPPSISSVVAEVSDYDDDSEQEEDDFEFPNAASVRPRPPPPSKPSSSNQAKGKQKEEQRDDSWAKVPAVVGRTFKKVIPEEDMCPVHGVLCSKGICSIMKKKQRERERLVKKAEQDANRQKRGKWNAQEEEEAAPNGAGSNDTGIWNDRGEKEKRRTGDWGPKKERNAKQRDNDGDNMSESAFSRSTGRGSRKSASGRAAEDIGRPAGPAAAIPKGKGKAKDTRLWSERVDEDDSELGSVMEFDD